MEARRKFDIFKMKTIFSDCYNTLSKKRSLYHTVISFLGCSTKYIQEQEKHDIAIDKLSVKEYEDHFRNNGK